MQDRSALQEDPNPLQLSALPPELWYVPPPPSSIVMSTFSRWYKGYCFSRLKRPTATPPKVEFTSTLYYRPDRVGECVEGEPPYFDRSFETPGMNPGRVCLLFYILATSKVISGHVPTCGKSRFREVLIYIQYRI